MKNRKRRKSRQYDALVQARKIAELELEGFAEALAEIRKNSLDKPPYKALVQAREIAEHELKKFAEDTDKVRRRNKRKT